MSLLRNLSFPLSPIYGFIMGLRNWLFNYGLIRQYDFDIPVIVVGNITVGGTGKTPHVEHMIRALSDHFKIAILSRGYRRKSSDYIIANSHSSVMDIGDEPKQLKQKFLHTKVVVDANRVRAINRLCSEESDLDLIILDDAYQHRKVKPGLSILLIDYSRPLHKDHYLPMGDLREAPKQQKRANIVILTKVPAHTKPIDLRLLEKDLNLEPHQKLFCTTLSYGNLVPIFDKELPQPKWVDEEGAKTNIPIILVTGIANSEPLKQYLGSLTSEIFHFCFPDHHYYTTHDIEVILKKYHAMESRSPIIVTTEKDTMRLVESEYAAKELGKVSYYVPMKIEFLQNTATEFNQIIADYVRKNKRDGLLHRK